MRKSIIFSFACLVMSIVLFFASGEIKSLWEEPMNPSVFPYVMSALLFFASVADLIIELFHFFKEEKAKINNMTNSMFSFFRRTKKGDPKSDSGYSALYVAFLSLLYVFGLTFVGFYVSSAVYILAIVGGLCFFAGGETWIKRALTIGITMSVVIICILAFANEYMHIYFPSKGILW